MKRAIILPAVVTAFVALAPMGVAVADNPHDGTTGQPGKEEVEIEVNPDLRPPGHRTDGFLNVASSHYADGTESPLNPARGNTDKAVSQYDVAGFQWCRHHSADTSIC
jgi:hypothetical protein